MTFKKAERKQGKLRMMIYGISGSGKTYSSILIASGLSDKIAMIGTERGSEELYADLASFDIQHIAPPYEPQKLINAIEEAEKANYGVLIIDSFSHFWMGEGGILDIHQDKTAADPKRNSFYAWRTVTPIHNALLDRILAYPGHVICCVRAKTGYNMEDGGKKISVKTSLEPQQRPGTEFEFRFVFELTMEHKAVVVKDVMGLFGDIPFTPNKDTGEKLRKWLEEGSSIEELPQVNKDNPISESQKDAIGKLIKKKKEFNDIEAAEIWKWVQKLSFAEAERLQEYLDSIKTFSYDDYNTVKQEYIDTKKEVESNAG